MSAFVRLGFDNDRCGLHRAAHPDRNAPIPFEFEPVRTAEDARNALTAVIGAMAAGEITGAEVAEAMRPIQLFLETLVLR